MLAHEEYIELCKFLTEHLYYCVNYINAEFYEHSV